MSWVVNFHSNGRAVPRPRLLKDPDRLKGPRPNARLLRSGIKGKRCETRDREVWWSRCSYGSWSCRYAR